LPFLNCVRQIYILNQNLIAEIKIALSKNIAKKFQNSEFTIWQQL